jgi:hypothetical protein
VPQTTLELTGFSAGRLLGQVRPRVVAVPAREAVPVRGSSVPGCRPASLSQRSPAPGYRDLTGRSGCSFPTSAFDADGLAFGESDRLLQCVDEELITISSIPGLLQSRGRQVEVRSDLLKDSP